MNITKTKGKIMVRRLFLLELDKKCIFIKTKKKNTLSHSGYRFKDTGLLINYNKTDR